MQQFMEKAEPCDGENTSGPIVSPMIEPPAIRSLATDRASVRLKKILVPVGFSAASERILPYAVALAGHLGGAIQLLKVVPCCPLISSLRCLRMKRPTETGLGQASKLLIQLARAEVPPGIRGGTTIRVGEPAREIATAARELGADLIVMAVPGRWRFKHRLRSSLAERVVRAQPCLVLSVPEDLLLKGQGQPVPACKNILVQVDLTEFSRMTLKWAYYLAGRMGARVTLRYAPALRAKRPSPRTNQQNRGQLQLPKAFELKLAEWCRHGASMLVDVDLLPETAPPDAQSVGQTVGRAASDLMLIGTRRCSWWKRLSQQEIPERLLSLVPCPVLSVPERVVTTPLDGQPIRTID